MGRDAESGVAEVRALLEEWGDDTWYSRDVLQRYAKSDMPAWCLVRLVQANMPIRNERLQRRIVACAMKLKMRGLA